MLAGKAFGDTGPYEEIVGKVYYSLDPDNPRNKSIADLDKAPRDAAGRVAFVADLFVLAPKDKSHGNGVALFDVLNRGRKNMHDELVLDDENNQMVRALVHAIAILPTASLGVADQLFVFFGSWGAWFHVFNVPR